MDISIVIVNYNVKHFVEQCLHSVEKALKNVQAEVFVVDNNSVDGSAQLINEKFPDVTFIQNTENVGFSRANNQAIQQAKGKYVLLLNPDTVVEEDTFEKVLSFMEAHPEAGGLGVKMIDGKGVFLPESKRGLPTPWVAFYKMFGLSRLFPMSHKFGKYHLSYLDKNEVHEIDVLAGAFMLLRKSALDEVGLLDETFFMYGEDIDLSYRIQKGGYKNYYYPKTTIIHYKGESTKKGSLNYVKVFYNAMVIFARKHFSGRKASVFALLIHLAIYFRALLSATKRIMQKIYLPLADALLIFAGFWLITPFWEQFQFHQPDYYPPQFMQFVVPVYSMFFLFGILFSGGYKKPVSIYKVGRGILWGLISLLLAYSLVDEKFRFSRALILLGTAWSAIVLIAYRLLGHALKLSDFRIYSQRTRKIAIVGHSKEARRVQKILEETRIRSQMAGFIALDNSDKGQNYMGELSQLEEIIRINRIDEIVFCAENISSADIIKAMLDLSRLDIDYKIAPPESASIIGSNSIHTAGDLYVVNLNAISKSANKRKKRLLDLVTAFLILCLSPVLIWFITKKRNFIKNIFRVIIGKRSWIGYIPGVVAESKLPSIKDGILNPGDRFPGMQFDKEKSVQLNRLYAKDYNLLSDIELLLKAWKKMDR
ncbi:glycosyltransferase family 2 protein [Draconibacterium halophilum]|uniref:Glycosyltransferase n=1 Tax=Draconibacterium halophilum TaxID=2706887 RepID=A0A6C0RF19_9BACT|nr:glycosyltransferase [Draconibacterium halophilum]QIA08556.1 glycosyltransferase [Draconibacterium halophilum]